MENKTGWPVRRLIDDIYIPMFHRHGEQAIPFLVESSVSKRMFLSAYNNIPPLEGKEKEETIKYVENIFPDKPSEEKEDAAKIIYTIGTLL